MTGWDEIDKEAKERRLPTCRMKMKREYVVLLSEQALVILERMNPITKHREYVFPPGYRNPLEPINS